MLVSVKNQTYILEAVLVLLVVGAVARLSAPGEAPLHLSYPGGKRYAALMHAGVVGLTAAALIVGLYYATPKIEQELGKLEGQSSSNGGDKKHHGTTNSDSCKGCPTGACF